MSDSRLGNTGSVYQWLLTCLAAGLLSACGGGGGGGSSSANSTSMPTGNAATAPTVVVAANGGSRQVLSSCPMTQKLGAATADNLRIDAVNWLQTVQMDSLANTTFLVANKPVSLRIDVLADQVRALPATRTLQVYNPTTSTCTNITMTTPSSVPTTKDATTLNTAFVATIPASLVQAGMSVSLLLDDASGRSASQADQTYRVIQPNVTTIAPVVVHVLPISVLGQVGHFTSAADIQSLIMRLYPVSSVTVIVESPISLVSLAVTNLLSTLGQLVGTLGIMNNALSELDDKCSAIIGAQSSARTAPKCIGLFPDNLSFQPTSGSGEVVGLAYIGGTTLLANSISALDIAGTATPYQGSWINQSALTVGHEMGHIFGLSHGNCGGATGIDPRLYADGHLDGSAGYDSVRNVYFSSTKINTNGTPIFADLMSYCSDQWTSDRGYLAALSYLTAGAADVSAAADVSSASDIANLGKVSAAQVVDATTHHWLKLSLNSDGWHVRSSSFAPSVLHSSDLSLNISSQTGNETLPLLSAVISTGDGVANYGPFFIDIGSRSPVALQVLSGSTVMATLATPSN